MYISLLLQLSIYLSLQIPITFTFCRSAFKVMLAEKLAFGFLQSQAMYIAVSTWIQCRYLETHLRSHVRSAMHAVSQLP